MSRGTETSTVFTCAVLPAPQHARTLHTLLLRKLLVCWAKASHPSSPFLPSAQWGSQSNLFLMGKHRHEYARTHAHTHTSDSGVRDTQCSLHPKMGRTLGLSLPLAELPKVPHLHHTQPELHRHTQAASRCHRHLESPITATHHGLPRGHPLPQPHTRWYARTHESQPQSHTTDSLTRTQSKQSWSHIWIPAPTQNTHPSTQITEHLQKRRAPPPPPPPSPAPSALTPLRSAVGNRYILHAGTSGCLACAWGKRG